MTTRRVFSKPRTREQRRWARGAVVRREGDHDAWIVTGYYADGTVAIQRAMRRIDEQRDPAGEQRCSDVGDLRKRTVCVTPELRRWRAEQAAQRPRKCESCGQWVGKRRKIGRKAR